MSDIGISRKSARTSLPTTTTDIETMHDVLSDWERCAILYSLQRRGGSAAVAAVVSDIVGWRRGHPDPDPADDDVIARVHDQIGPEHLEKLDEFGVLEYVPERGRVRLAEDMQVSISEPWVNPTTDTHRSHQSTDDGSDV